MVHPLRTLYHILHTEPYEISTYQASRLCTKIFIAHCEASPYTVHCRYESMSRVRHVCVRVPMQEDQRQMQLLYAISMALQMGFLIVAPLIGFLLLGRWLDQELGTHPFLLLGGIAIGLGITAYELYHSLHPFLFSDHDTDRT